MMIPQIILVYGLPGSGKTYFATKLKQALGDRIAHVNGDDIRQLHNDWDFTPEGRTRQAHRMREYANGLLKQGKHVVLDFVCPLRELRRIINPDILVWANRTPVRDFPDTTAMFEAPDFKNEYVENIIEDTTDVDGIIGELSYNLASIDDRKPTAMMIGRFQPFHAGHKALFEAALAKHGQVCIVIRCMPPDDKNPLNPEEVAYRIKRELAAYLGTFTIEVLPNIVDVVYGRDVGWTMSKIDLPEEIEAISATKIRATWKEADR
jgi:cytidyltransferase-like protein